MRMACIVIRVQTRVHAAASLLAVRSDRAAPRRALRSGASTARPSSRARSARSRAPPPREAHAPTQPPLHRCTARSEKACTMRKSPSRVRVRSIGIVIISPPAEGAARHAACSETAHADARAMSVSRPECASQLRTVCARAVRRRRRDVLARCRPWTGRIAPDARRWHQACEAGRRDQK